MSAVSTALRLSATGYEFTGLVPGVPVATEIAINVLGQVAALMNDAFLVSLFLYCVTCLIFTISQLYRAYAIAIHKLKVVAIPILLWTASLSPSMHLSSSPSCAHICHSPRHPPKRSRAHHPPRRHASCLYPAPHDHMARHRHRTERLAYDYDHLHALARTASHGVRIRDWHHC
jgi:hypothetical protein